METKLDLNPETIEALQDLIEANIDSKEILLEAVDAVDDESMEVLFGRVAQARAAHTQELSSYVRANDETPELEGSTGGTVRQTWLKFRSAINGGDPKVVLIEAERAEDVIKAKYEDLLVKTAGSAMNDILMRQFREVKQHHDLVRDLRDAQLAA